MMVTIELFYIYTFFERLMFDDQTLYCCVNIDYFMGFGLENYEILFLGIVLDCLIGRFIDGSCLLIRGVRFLKICLLY